jgi:Gpi18-like mannosyltransferase
MQKLIKSKIFWIFFVAFCFRLILSFLIWHPDLNNHIDWGIRFWQYGPAKFYTENVWNFTWPNQPPGTIYMFAGIRKLFEFIFGIFWIINTKIPAFPSIVISFFETNLYPALIKLPAILADFGIAYLIYKWTNKKWASLIFLINPVIWYNSSVWGQYDSVINFFALLAFYLLNKKKLLFAIIAFILSIYIKASLLIFAPIFLIIAIRQKYSFKKYILSLVLSLIVVALVTLPFSQGEPFSWLYYLYKDKVFIDQLHVVSANAFNLWGAIFGVKDSAVEIKDFLPFFGFTYQIWGYILFIISYIPLLYKVYRNNDLKVVAWTLALTAFASFMLLTNMHERYLYPLFPYLTILLTMGVVANWEYWLITAISLLGMYNFWFTPKINIIISFLSFGDRLMPRILGFLLFILLLKLYTRYNEIK